MKNIYCLCAMFLLCAVTFLFSGCSENDESLDPTVPDTKPETEIVEGPDEIIANRIIRVGNLLFKVDEGNTCTLISRYDEDFRYDGFIYTRTYYSNFPYPVFNVPNEISFNGNTYQVTKVRIEFGVPKEKDNHIADVKYLSIPSNVLSYYGNGINPISLSIGANVREVSDVRAEKIFWLPNTPPSGYQDAKGRVQYASSDVYRGEVIVYPHLSSMFTVDGISYVMTNPAERKCDLVGVFAPPADEIKCNGIVVKDGISFEVDKIAQYAFFECSNITKVDISNIATIEDYAFSGCSELSSLTLANIEYIGNSSFNGCAISKVNIPGTVYRLGTAAFKDCENLSEVSFEDGDRRLTIERPETLKPEGYYVQEDFDIFLGTKVKKLYIGRDLFYDSYGKSPFYRMDTLEEVEIRQGETEISNSMFYGCIALNSVVIGDYITKIGDKAFSGCSSMTSFKFGKELRTIGADAFSDCTALKTFTSNAINPPTCGSQALDDINKWECVLHVPTESIDAYKKANQWKNFLKIE